MTIQEFEKWYNEKSKHYRGGHNWMQYKARHFISKSSFSFEEADELAWRTNEYRFLAAILTALCPYAL